MIRNNIFAFGEEGAFKITALEEHNSLTLVNNILVTNNAPTYAFEVSRGWFIDDSNIYWDYNNNGNSINIFDKVDFLKMTKLGYYNNAGLVNPLFKDAANRNFTLALNSPVLDTGFVPWEYNAGTKTLFE